MCWIITMKCNGEDGNKSAVVLGVIERAVDGTVPENVGVNLNESKRILRGLQETVVGQQLQVYCERRGNAKDHRGLTGHPAPPASGWPAGVVSRQNSMGNYLASSVDSSYGSSLVLTAVTR